MTRLTAYLACAVVLAAVTSRSGVAAPQSDEAAPAGRRLRKARTEERRARPLYFAHSINPAPTASQPAQSTKPKPPPAFTQRDDYVIEPPDLVDVTFESARPGRPLQGERPVRPEGSISLGWYGDLHVAGLTVAEVKRKLIGHLRRFFADEVLGIVVVDASGRPVIDPATAKPKTIDPKDSTKVHVRVTKCNSKFFYVRGEVVAPGRYAFTGTEKVIDAIRAAGGLKAAIEVDKASPLSP